MVQYFQNCGEIECYDFQRGHYFDSIIIEYKNLEDIWPILTKRYHRIQKYIMTVELASEQLIESSLTRTHRPFMKKEPLFELSDSLLVKIFDHLDVRDLCSVANTCIHFQKIAHQLFSAKFNKITWRAGDSVAMNVFNTFGRLITSLDVDVTEPQNHFLNYIAETCNYNLSHLSLWMQSYEFIQITKETTMKLKLLFSQLYRLDLYCHQLFNFETTRELFTSCLELKSLALNCMTDMNFEMNRMNIQFPKLEELKFYLNHAINDDGLEILLSHNANIKKLYLDECTKLSAKAIEVMVRRLPNLEELSLGLLLQKIKVQELRPIGELKRLQSINIILGPALPIVHVVCERQVQIESLMLWYVEVNDALIERLLYMKTLKNLTIYSNDHVMNFIRDEHLQLLAQKLPSLTVMRLGYANQITIDGLKNCLYYAKNLTLLALTGIKNVTINDKYNLLNCVSERPNLDIEIE